MEFILFYILILFLELYTVVIVLYVIIQIVRRKKLLLGILLIETGCLLLFFYLKYLVGQHELIVFGAYKEDPQDFGAGIANVVVYTYNLSFVIGLFLVTQLFFWVFFTRRFISLNKQEKDGEIEINKFLDHKKPE